MTAPLKMPDWAYNQMIDGLQKLLVLRLQGSPPADTISALAAVWEEALTPITWAWQPETDGERLPIAFRQLIRQAEKWTQPAQLIKQIPPRNTLTAALLPNKQPISPEQREANRQRLQQILNQLLERKKT
nr:MAG TPA: hypothetical protein [Caudoviricetes sp.]